MLAHFQEVLPTLLVLQTLSPVNKCFRQVQLLAKNFTTSNQRHDHLGKIFQTRTTVPSKAGQQLLR